MFHSVATFVVHMWSGSYGTVHCYFASAPDIYFYSFIATFGLQTKIQI